MTIGLTHEGDCGVGGVNIHYIRSCESLPPLVGLHGLMGSGPCLKPATRGLEDQFAVILPDSRGHGGSDKPQTGYSYTHLTRDVIGLIRELKLDLPVLLGHSMGGMVAAVAAAELGTAARALVLIDPTFISLEWQHEVYRSDVAVEHHQALKSTKVELLQHARARHPHRSAEIIECLVEARLHTSPCAFDVLIPPNPDWRALVQRICVPVLLLLGEHGVVSVETAEELQRLNPLLRYHIVEAAGHGMPYDKPDQCCATVRAFLASLEATCRADETSDDGLVSTHKAEVSSTE